MCYMWLPGPPVAGQVSLHNCLLNHKVIFLYLHTLKSHLQHVNKAALESLECNSDKARLAVSQSEMIDVKWKSLWVVVLYKYNLLTL